MTETKRDELLKKIELFTGSIGYAVAELKYLREGVDDGYMLLVIQELRTNIARLESYLDDLEELADSGQLED